MSPGLQDSGEPRPIIAGAFQARVRYDEPMAAHTSWRAGGRAQVYFSPRDADELAAFLHSLPASVPVYWVGLGTNLLVREGGIRGVVIATPGAFTRIERRSQQRVHCEASVPCARIARCCANWELSAGEFFSGIPGTLGGALAMNAGAFGDETWRHVIAVETISRSGRRRTRAAAQYRVGYREVALADAEGAEGAEAGEPGQAEWFLAAELQFDPGAGGGGTALQALMQRRRDTQPLGAWSCGSVFKNPPGDHAARLIEAAGLKGYRIGDAVVSEKHANFIINQGHASAAELEQLIRHVQAAVQRAHGVVLEPEVRIIGESGAGLAPGEMH
ncbi:MAG TPA: UDP-N-acetylmuramate dehydrogenase [Steroidobacteraceae bacterium]|jgi:UDP-N-acetylmuramate dehydrogenase|nr:UDP-N-acetylmuramate dehydrogenase [Steroidobacteraceae bacterium]